MTDAFSVTRKAIPSVDLNGDLFNEVAFYIAYNGSQALNSIKVEIDVVNKFNVQIFPNSPVSDLVRYRKQDDGTMNIQRCSFPIILGVADYKRHDPNKVKITWTNNDRESSETHSVS